ncbi:hypothetical protein B566_EDAN004492 [Ephemera danica]|nr:hypothetical protein B566_EDAN004492 [Ephemera danica]
MNNAVYGKTMENVRNRINLEIVTENRSFERQDFYKVMKENFKEFDTSNYSKDHPCYSLENKKHFDMNYLTLFKNGEQMFSRPNATVFDDSEYAYAMPYCHSPHIIPVSPTRKTRDYAIIDRSERARPAVQLMYYYCYPRAHLEC